MAMSYTTLIGGLTTAGSIASWGNHTSIVNSAPTILEEAEAFIYSKLRHFRMLKEVVNLVTVVGNDYIALPADFVEDMSLYFRPTTTTGYAKVTRKPLQEVKANYQFDGSQQRVRQMPRIFYNNADQLRFDSPADLVYTCELSYFARLEALSPTNLTNFLTLFYPRLVRCACMIGVAEFMKDAGMGNYDRTYWEDNAVAEIMVAQTEADRSQRSVEAGAIII